MIAKPIVRMTIGLTVALLGATTAGAQALSVVSARTDKAPEIDGKRDEVWNKAKPLAVELEKLMYTPNDYSGERKVSVKLSSLHDGEYIYFLVQWNDSTQSLEQEPWVKQADGTWKQKRAADEFGRDNTNADDKLGMIWNIDIPGFERQGCNAVCHKARGGRVAGHEDSRPGRKWTNAPGTTADLWTWMAASTNPVGQVLDGFIDDTKDPAQNPDFGRKADDGAGGPAFNANAGKTAPAFMSPSPADGVNWVRDDTKVPFADTFKPGDAIGSVIVAPYTGPRGDIQAAALWENGTWTLELKRKLVTSGPNAKQQDVQFDNLKKPYFFGVSVFDHTDSAHLYREEAMKLTFD